MIDRIDDIDLLDPVERDHPLLRGCVSWWVPLPNLYGSTKYWDVIGRNHGTLTNGPTWRGDGSIAYDGTNDYISVADTAALNPTEITLAITVVDRSGEFPTASNYRGILMKRNDSLTNRSAWSFDRNRSSSGSPTECRFYINITGTWSIWSSTGLGHAANILERLAVTYKAGSAPRFFRNGRLAASAPTGPGTYPNLPSNTAPVGIGAFPTFSPGDNPWNGLLSYPIIHNRALSDQEIVDDYDQWRRGFPNLLHRLSRTAYSLPVAPPPAITRRPFFSDWGSMC